LIITAHGTLFAANQPVSATAELTALMAGRDIVGLRGMLSLYTVASHIVTATEEMLQQVPITVTTEMTPYLQLPTTLPQRVRELAVDITSNAPTPYDKAVNIESYLRTYSYTLDLPPFPEGRDLVDYFLFDAPGGYCDYYASAMVVMLRAVGVPARLASGYLTGVYDPRQGAYRVIGANAHSWPEVYFKGIGWVEFEPTASQSLLAREQSAPPISLSGEQVRAAEVERQQRATLTRNMALASILLSLVAGGLAARWIRRERRLTALPAEATIPLLYQRLRRRGAWLGVAVRPSDTPDVCRGVQPGGPALRRRVGKPRPPSRKTRLPGSGIVSPCQLQPDSARRKRSARPGLPGAPWACGHGGSAGGGKSRAFHEEHEETQRFNPWCFFVSFVEKIIGASHTPGGSWTRVRRGSPGRAAFAPPSQPPASSRRARTGNHEPCFPTPRTAAHCHPAPEIRARFPRR
jgi:transglutaminase-like putative cysteine protease